MNTDPHNLMNPLREKFPYFIRHEKLYRMIHLQLMKKWFQYFVLFFIIGSICSIIYGSFEESAPYHNYLYTFNYLASFIFTIEYGLRIAAAPVQYASCYIHSTILLPLFSPLNTDYESQRLQYNMPVAIYIQLSCFLYFHH